MSKNINSKGKIQTIKRFLIANADSIQKLATKHHQELLGDRKLRVKVLSKYKDEHIKIVREIANYLDKKHFSKGIQIFNQIGEELAQDAVSDGLTIEETVDGTIFLKQAMWKKLEEDSLFDLDTKQYHELSMIVGTYCDILSSKIAITYHKQRLYIEGNLQFLAKASQVLSSSLDYQTTLNTIAQLAVPHIADWCAIDMLDPQNQLVHLAVAHKDPDKVKWAKKLQNQRPTDLTAPHGVAQVLRSGKSEIYPHITDAFLKAASKTQTDYKLAKKIGFTSAMIVPLFNQKKTIGTITFVTTETRRNYNKADLTMAEELATRASVAIENALLYKGSQEAISLRDDFISVASHELKTPVTSAKMFAQILKKHSEQIGDSKASTYLNKMDSQLNKLTELIYDLLNVSKIQAGKIEFCKDYFDFDQAIFEVVEVLQQSEPKHTIKIVGKTGKQVYADQERIGQVVNNLISNAIKYSPKSDKVIVTLSSKSGQVQVAIKDFGIGMEKEHLERIFERFYRVFDTTDKTFPGLGIGLYISSEIVKRHFGRMWVESNPGKGSTFYFSLPVEGKKKTKDK